MTGETKIVIILFVLLVLLYPAYKLYQATAQDITPISLARQPARYHGPTVPDFACPVPPHRNRCLTSEYGWRESPNHGRMQYHTAIDVSGGPRAEIMASLSGTVYEVGKNPVDGIFVTILHENGYRTRYCHLWKAFIRKGDNVERLQVIGRMGDTGAAVGEHLHFEVWSMGVALDPEQVLKLATIKGGYF